MPGWNLPETEPGLKVATPGKPGCSVLKQPYHGGRESVTLPVDSKPLQCKAMSGQSLIDRYDIFFDTATITAHANGFVLGFRQRDVRFFIELFTNYVDPSSEWEGLPFQNTHVSRYIESLVKEGFARRVPKQSHPAYKLNRVGLIELISRVVRKSYFNQAEHFFFVFSFIENYTPRILAMVRKEGKQFPYAMQLEIESLLDLDVLLKKQMDFARRELRSLEKRIADQIGTRNLAEKMIAERRSFADISRAVEKQFPYSMNTKKPMSELFSMGTEKQGLWEMTIGGPRRNQQQWIPARERLELHIQQLERLKKSREKAASTPE